MMPAKDQLFRTVIEIPDSKIKIDYKHHTMMIGSCFTENMGSLMEQMKFPVTMNPTGIVYNPMSALTAIKLLINDNVYTEQDLFFSNGLWASYDHHGSFSSSSHEDCLDKINSSLSHSREKIKKTKLLFVTFGTSWVYTLQETGKIVSNCHKQPDHLFRKSLLEIDEIIHAYEEVLETLYKVYPDLHIIFTVSPIRHWKDGAHGNQISKSLLLLAIEKLNKKFSYTGYFPSYEIVMDELRDYRFYDEDMLHISDVAVKYIWERFQDIFLNTETRIISKEIADIQKSLLHRPLNPGTTQHNNFRKNLQRRIEEFQKIHPSIKFRQE